MFLHDTELTKLLPDLDIETEGRRKFDPASQIQPCSIDLRLDQCFWMPRVPFYRASIDLLNVRGGETDMLRMFRRKWFHAGDRIRLGPGEMVFGRITPARKYRTKRLSGMLTNVGTDLQVCPDFQGRPGGLPPRITLPG